MKYTKERLEPKIKKALRTAGIRPRKRWSQSFLVDSGVRDFMITATGVQKGDSVLEIGPGTGVLTERLIENGVHVVAVERDKALSRFLKKRFRTYPHLRVIEMDFLTCELDQMQLPAGTHILGNLPYHITTPILFHLAKYRACFSTIWLTMQKEVARRILAPPGSKDYGVLTLSLGLYFGARIALDISRKAFYPVPKVDSAFVEFHALSRPPVAIADPEFFLHVVRTTFQKRRKQMLNSVLPLVAPAHGKEKIRNLFKDIGLDPACRPEQCSMKDFACLARVLHSLPV